MHETKKVTEQILRNVAKGVKSQFVSPVGPMGSQSKKLFLYLPIE